MKRWIQVNGHHIYLEAHGSENGLPIVLLHHGLGAVSSWKSQVPALTQAGYRTIAYDRWGHGKSDPRSVYGMPYFEADLADLICLLASLEIDRAAFIGHSDGGKIAMYLAASNPQRVACLVLVAAHIYVESKMDPGIREVRRQFEQDERFREKLRRVHGDKAEALFDGWYLGWLRPENLSWDMRPLISQIACPTLVVQGMEDEHTTPQHAQDIANAIPAAQLWLLPDAGHMLPQDFPEVFNAKMLDFLSQYYPAAVLEVSQEG